MALSRKTSAHLAAVVLVGLLAACGGRSEEELVASGKDLLAKKDLPAAIIQFKSAIQQRADFGEARLLLGVALLDSGDPVSALVELQKAQELQIPDEQVMPPIARSMVLVGDVAKVIAQFGGVRLNSPKASADLNSSLATAHMVRGDLEKARALVDSALQATPDFPAAAVLDARLLASEGRFDDAVRLLEANLQKHPDNEAAGVLKGEVLLNGKRDPVAALAAFQRVMTDHPKAVGAYTAAISILGEQKKDAEAKATFDKLKAALPNHPETLFYEAQFAFVEKDYKRTREIANRLLKFMPENPRLLELTGLAEFRQGNYVEAEAFLAKALKNAPGLSTARQMLAHTFVKTRQPTKALETLQPLIEGKNAQGISLALAAEAYMMMGELKKADQAYALAEKLAPQDARVRTAAAVAQMARGNNAAAVSQLEAVVAEDKGYRSDIALISARLRQSDYNGALKAIDGLAAKTPGNPLSDNLRGRVLLQKRDLDAATRSFQAALAKEPNYFPAVASLAAMDLAAGKVEEARKRFEEQTKAVPKSHEPWLALAELSARTGGSSEEVVGYMRNGVKANGGSAMPHLSLINQLLNMRDGKAALTAAREASAAMPSNYDITAALGRAQIASDSPEQAVQTFKQLTAVQTSNAEHQIRLAEALVATKDMDGARKALQRAMEINPELPGAKIGLVRLAILDNRHQDAIELTQKLQKKDPKDPMPHRLEGDVELSRKNGDAAIAAYRKAFQISRTTDQAVNLHTTYIRLGRKEEASRLAAEWTREKPKDVMFRYHLGDIALAQKDTVGAEAHYRAVLEMQPTHPLALNNVAWLMVTAGKPGAVALAEKANKQMPGNPALLDTLASALAAENQLARAVEVQKSAVARSPSSASLKLNLAKLLIKSGDKTYAKSELEDLARLGDKFSGHSEVTALLKTL